MLAKRGGLAVQKDYRLQGKNPTAAANAARRSRVVKVVKARDNSAALGRIRFSLPPELLCSPSDRGREEWGEPIRHCLEPVS
jgi:hypothetical protein